MSSPHCQPYLTLRPSLAKSACVVRGLRWLAIAVMFGLCTAYADAATAKDYAVLVEATVSDNPPSIRLSWPGHSTATGYAVSRKLRTDASWGAATTLSSSSSGWTDNSVSVGTKYEYKVSRASSVGPTAYGYLCAGIRVAPVDHLGTVILMVDASVAAPLAGSLTRLMGDLIGDGWSVIRHDVSRSSTVTGVKALIAADYNAAPGEVRSVFLFGHVPVPYSGDKAFAGGHVPEHVGAHPADLYYGEMNGAWTDSSVNHSSADQWTNVWPKLANVPGDGRFDQSRIPGGTVELEVGRVDLADMPAFLPKTEIDLLRQYLDKDHYHRHAMRVLPRRGLLEDHFGEFSGSAFAADGWRAWSALFGSAAISEGDFSALSTQGYLGFFMCGPGWNTSCQSVGRAVTTKDFALSDPKMAFAMLFGSHYGDWNIPDNFLRAPLATTTYGLASVYDAPHWFLHTMAMGGTIGETTKLTQNNQTLYSHATPAPWETSNSTFIDLMGDPTLRLYAVVPPSGLSITANNGSNPVLTWSASSAASLGYHIYRAANPNGPFTRRTTSPIATTQWTDTSVASGAFTYQVKAVKLEATGGGTYMNTSQAITGTITLGGNPPPVANAGVDRAITLPTSSLTLNGSATDNGSIASYAWSKISGGAATIGSPSSASTVVSGVASGTYAFRLTVSDNQGASASNDVQVTVNAAQVSGAGFAAAYFANPTLAGTAALTRTDATINFDWAHGGPGGGLPVDSFSARWTGQVQVPTSGAYTFHVTSDDGVRLWVNNVLIVDKWINQSAMTWSGTAALSAGQMADVKMEYFDNLGGAMAKLEWSSATMARALVVPGATGGTGGGSLAAGWTTGDVGAVGTAGSASQVNGTWTIAGSGEDIWGNADELHFTSRAMSGDGEITARVVSQGNSDGWAKAGVMIRESRKAGSCQAMTAITPAHGVSFLRRGTTDGASSSTPGAMVAAPYWVRLRRIGYEISGYQSADGVTWKLVCSDIVVMGANVQIGFAVTSHQDGVLSTVVFDHVDVIAIAAGNG